MSSFYCEVFEDDLRARIANPEASFALACWEMARVGDGPPEEAAFRAFRLGWLMPDVMILRRNADGELLYEHYGANIARNANFDMTGLPLSAFKGPMLDFYKESYARAERSLRPLATIHRLGRYDERPMWERLILPVREAGGGIAFHVVNKVRKLEDDFANLDARSRRSGVIALQFVRDGDGAIADAMISGANAAARAMTGRRLDELLDQSIRGVFPGVIDHALWDRYLEVAATRTEQSFRIEYRADGLDDVFDVRLYPFRDGVAIEFRGDGRNKADAPSHGSGLAA